MRQQTEPRRTAQPEMVEGLGSRSRATAIRQSVDWELIRDLAFYAEAAYEHATVVDPLTHAQALILKMPDGNIVIAIRGSHEAEDFIQDGKFWMVPPTWLPVFPDPMKMHHGFNEDFMAIKSEIVSHVKEIMKWSPGAKVYVVGHSLGGGIAVPCGLYLSIMDIPVAGVYTFGQPRVGNKAFRDFYNQHLGDVTFHIVNADDPVPLLPPLLLGYRDEGNEIFLPKKKQWQLNPSIGFELVSDCLGILYSWCRRRLAFLPNHFMEAYLQRMEACA